MSRSPLTPLDSAAREVPGLEVAVGWDRPLATYFAIVSGEDEPGDEDAEDDADPVLLWLGTTYGEILDPASIISAVARFAILPDDLAHRPAADRAPAGELGKASRGERGC